MRDVYLGSTKPTRQLATFALAAILLVIIDGRRPHAAPPMTARELQAVVCRVSNDVSGAKNLGSGTLIDKTEDGREGLVLTCAHLFREGVGEVVVAFSNGRRHLARIVDIDHEADLAALSIAKPAGEPAGVALNTRAQSSLHACGYGPDGVYRCAVGSRVGEAASAGRMSLLLDDSVRSGDSGGGVFDEQGRLVAVVWGESQGVTYASYGQPLRRFLNRVLGRRTSVVYSCPDGTCPRQPGRSIGPRRDNTAPIDARWADVQRQLDQLREQKQDRGDYVHRSELPTFSRFASNEDIQRIDDESATRHASLLAKLQSLDGRTAGKAAGAAAVSLLGLSGPAGWAVIAASTFGGWLIGRQMKRSIGGVGGRRRRRFRSANEG